MKKSNTQEKIETMSMKKKTHTKIVKKKINSLLLTFDPGFKFFKVSTAQMEFKANTQKYI